MEEVEAPVLHKIVQAAVVDNTELPQLFTTFTIGIADAGFIVMVNVFSVPVQPL